MKKATALIGILIVVLFMVSVSGCSTGPAPTTTPTASTSTTAATTPKPTSSAVVQTTPPSQLSIITPKNNAQLGQAVEVSGSSNPEAGQELWLLVYNYKVNRYYPQEGPLTPDATGNWSSFAYLGTASAGVGEKFDIVAVLANQSANADFVKYYTNSKTANSFEGMLQLPNGIIVKERVTVTRTS